MDYWRNLNLSNIRPSILTWFRERRTAKIVEKLSNHISKVIDTCNENLNAMIAITADQTTRPSRITDAEAALRRVLIQERAADHIKEELFKEISRAQIDAKSREDLFKLTYEIDGIANWVKASAKNSIIIIELKLELSLDIWTRLRTISEIIVSNARLIRKMLEILGINDDTLLNIRAEVESLEQSVDDLYFNTKKALLSLNLNVQSTILVDDLLEGLENYSDRCAAAADIMFILVMATR